jgi:hypothetical protein
LSDDLLDSEYQEWSTIRTSLYLLDNLTRELDGEKEILG